MEHIFKKGNVKIGLIYEQLNCCFPDDLDKYVITWQSKLGVSAETVYRSFALYQSSLMSTKLQAQFFKTFCFLYYNPNKIAKWGTRKGTTCPRCLLTEADNIHMFASCTY